MCSSAWANLHSDNNEFITYLRSGIGSNGKGGDQQCFSQNGSAGNEFRLGNECSTYGEFGVASFIKRAEKGSPVYGFGQIRLAYAPNGHTNWEGANGDNPIAIRETFAEIGGLTKHKLSFWAGKRFYREQDMYMNDFYYFADTSGNGAGVGGIPFVSGGKLSFAVMRETKDTETDNGRLSLTLLDLRGRSINLGNQFQLYFWLSHAMSSAGKDKDTLKEYDDATGNSYGLLLHKGLSAGFNQFSIIYGKGLMDDFNLYGDLSVIKGSDDARAQRKSNRLRVVEHLTYDLTSNLSFHFGSTLELRDNGRNQNNKEMWWNIGVHPVYFIDDNFQIAGQVGTSVIDPDGGPPRRLTRITIAPQVSVFKSIWSRPVVRVFYSRSFWSRSNRGIVGGEAYKYATAGTNIGAQIEIWY